MRLRLLALLWLGGCSGDAPAPVEVESRSTWGIIQEDIFATCCVSCHTAGTSFAQQSGLLLSADVAYSQLVRGAD